MTSPTVPCQQLPDLGRRTAILLGHFVDEQDPQRDDQVYLLAYLKRSENVLVGMSVLCESGIHDPILVLYRTLFELWAHATYLALEREAALNRLQEQLDYEKGRMDKSFGTELEVGGDSGRRLPFKELMGLLGPILIREDTIMMPNWTGVAYETEYRVASFHYVHGHLGSTVPYLDESGQIRTTVDESPGHHALAMGASLGCSLLMAACRSFESDPPEELKAIVTELPAAHKTVLETAHQKGER